MLCRFWPHCSLQADSHIPCRVHAVPLRVCLSHLIYTVRPCLIHTCHVMHLPCFDHAVLLMTTAQHVRRETACALPARVRLLPATTRSSTKVVIRSIPTSAAGGQCEIKRLSWTRKRVVAEHYKLLLHCWTSSSDIFGYHADFHEGHGTIGARHGRGMVCVNRSLALPVLPLPVEIPTHTILMQQTPFKSQVISPRQ